MKLPKIPNFGEDTFEKMNIISMFIKSGILPKDWKCETFSLDSVSVVDFARDLVTKNLAVCVLSDDMCYANWGNEIRFDYANHFIYLPYMKYMLTPNMHDKLIPNELEVQLYAIHSDLFYTDVLYCYDGKTTVYKLLNVNKLIFDIQLTKSQLYKIWVDYTVYSDGTVENEFIDIGSTSFYYRELRKLGKHLYKTYMGKRGVYGSPTLIRLLTQEQYVHYDPLDLGLIYETYTRPPNYYKIVFDATLYAIFMSGANVQDFPELKQLGVTKEFIGITYEDMPTFYLKHYYNRESKFKTRTFDKCIDVNNLLRKD